jgi:glycosyltransferase involved in cell wall biosynthesis
MTTPQPKKIGIDCRMYSKKFTGIGRYINQLITHLAKIDQKNQYYLFLNKDDFHLLQAPSSNFHKVLVDAPHYSFKEQTKFLISLYKQNLDLVHFTNFNHPLLYFKKQITTIHDLTLHFYPGRKFKNPIFRLAYKIILYIGILKSKSIIAISKNTKNDLKQYYPISTKKTKVIYNGIDTTFLEKDSKPNIKLPTEYILYTGNWREHKNITNLIKAFHILIQKYNYRGKLVLTGTPNPLYPEPTNYIQKHNLQNNILQLGLVDEHNLPHLYKKASVYVFPSLYEGFGLPILEAYASQTPVACSNKACLPEIAGDGSLFFDPTKPSEIASQTNKILKSPQIQKNLVQKGNIQLQKFSFLKMTKQTHQLYLQALKN